MHIYRYATLMRPPGPGAVPRKGLLQTIGRHFDAPSGHFCWGLAEYDRPLTDEEIREILHRYYCRLQESSPYDLSEAEYHERLLFCVREFVVNRLSLLRIVSESIEIDLIEQLLINTNRLLDLFQQKKSEGGLS